MCAYIYIYIYIMVIILLILILIIVILIFILAMTIICCSRPPPALQTSQVQKRPRLRGQKRPPRGIA